MVLEGFTPYPSELARMYIEKGYWLEKTVGDVLDRAVEAHPNQIALVDEKERVTYRELAEQVDRLALGLLALGIGREDRVTVQLPNWSEFVYVYLALARIGAVGVMALPQHRSREIGYMLRLTESTAYISPTVHRNFDYPEMIQGLRSDLPHLRHLIAVGESLPPGVLSLSELMEHEPSGPYRREDLLRLRPTPNDVSVLLWTGGTTAEPKGVPHTHNTHLSFAEYFSRTYPRNHETSFLISPPIAHNAALSVGLNAGLLYGEKLVLITGTGPEEILRTIERERITATFLVPTQAFAIINYPDLPRFDVSSLKVILCGAAHVPPELVREIRSKLDCDVINGYGMTEGLASATRIEDPLEVICETVGRPTCPGDEYKIVDDEGRALPPGQEGELIGRGPCVFRGYYKVPEHNRKAFNAEGFFFTGDLASFDLRGNLRITGRKKDMILRGGENISAEEIEELLILHPHVEEAAVVGMPDERLGERVCAYLRTPRGKTVTLEEVISFLRGQGIASFKLPERVELVAEFPLTHVGKVAKKLLREWITHQIDEERKAEGEK